MFDLSLPEFQNVDQSVVQAACDAVDQVAISEEVEEEFSNTVEITVWNKILPVNGIQAQEILARWLEIGFWDGVSDIVFVKRNGDIIAVLGHGESAESRLDEIKENEKQKRYAEAVMSALRQ